MNAYIHVVGIGPGGCEWMAPQVRQTIQKADVLVGYVRYLEQIESVAPRIRREGSGMRHEVERARRAIDLAIEGNDVVVVSGGDAGIYGMAGLVLELLEERPDMAVDVEVLPGITALSAAAALLGAPLMTDFAAISLSDYLTPLDTIMARLEAAVRADFVLCLYNPRSHQRRRPFDFAYALCLNMLGGDRPVGLVRAAFRDGQEVFCTTLKDLPALRIGMDCILIVGNRTTRIVRGKMITRRGYVIAPAGEGRA